MATEVRSPRLITVVGLIAAGGAFGSLVRYLTLLLFPFDPTGWPWATFIVNMAGCLLMGGFLGRIESLRYTPPYVTPFVTTGFLGGLTTFSTFAADVVRVTDAGRVGLALVYLLTSVVLGLLAVRIGWSIARGQMDWR